MKKAFFQILFMLAITQVLSFSQQLTENKTRMENTFGIKTGLVFSKFGKESNHYWFNIINESFKTWINIEMCMELLKSNHLSV